MKKINYLISMFAIVLALGVMSCSDKNEVVPTPPVEEGITWNDFDGQWLNTSTTYDGVTVDATDACQIFGFNGSSVDFNFKTNNNTVDLTVNCLGYTTDGSKVTYDDDNLTITLSLDQKYQIVKYDLTTIPKIMTLKIIDNAGGTQPEGLKWHLEK